MVKPRRGSGGGRGACRCGRHSVGAPADMGSGLGGWWRKGCGEHAVGGADGDADADADDGAEGAVLLGAPGGGELGAWAGVARHGRKSIQRPGVDPASEPASRIARHGIACPQSGSKRSGPGPAWRTRLERRRRSQDMEESAHTPGQDMRDAHTHCPPACPGRPRRTAPGCGAACRRARGMCVAQPAAPRRLRSSTSRSGCRRPWQTLADPGRPCAPWLRSTLSSPCGASAVPPGRGAAPACGMSPRHLWPWPRADPDTSIRHTPRSALAATALLDRARRPSTRPSSSRPLVRSRRHRPARPARRGPGSGLPASVGRIRALHPVLAHHRRVDAGPAHSTAPAVRARAPGPVCAPSAGDDWAPRQDDKENGCIAVPQHVGLSTIFALLASQSLTVTSQNGNAPGRRQHQPQPQPVPPRPGCTVLRCDAAQCEAMQSGVRLPHRRHLHDTPPMARVTTNGRAHAAWRAMYPRTRTPVVYVRKLVRATSQSPGARHRRRTRCPRSCSQLPLPLLLLLPPACRVPRAAHIVTAAIPRHSSLFICQSIFPSKPSIHPNAPSIRSPARLWQLSGARTAQHTAQPAAL